MFCATQLYVVMLVRVGQMWAKLFLQHAFVQVQLFAVTSQVCHAGLQVNDTSPIWP